jgi:hypothetical protein
MAVMRNLYDTEKLFLRDKIRRDCFIINFHLSVILFTHNLRMLTLPFVANITLGVINNIFLKSSLIRNFKIVINTQPANSHNLRFRFILI